MGNFSVKVGADNIGWQSVMGKHGRGVMNENGCLSPDLCAKCELVVGGTMRIKTFIKRHGSRPIGHETKLTLSQTAGSGRIRFKTSATSKTLISSVTTFDKMLLQRRSQVRTARKLNVSLS